jgi:hypothetical protein
MIRNSHLVILACACALGGCAVPKATVVEPGPKPPSPTAAATAAARVATPASDDGLRTGDLLVLPKDTEYRATNPALPAPNSGAGTVIVTPPSAPKPKPQAQPEE